MQRIAAIVALVLIAVPACVSAQTRTEIPIREVVQTDGVRRYAVPIKVGETMIEAGLDSGSTGLRVLPKTLRESDAKAGTQTDNYGYGSGTHFEGHVAVGTVSVGELSGKSTFQLIETVGCAKNNPQCPASRVPLDRFGIQGDGLPGEGFRAILGVNTANADVQNPFSAIGVKRWIIELPRPGSSSAGKIILDPDDSDIQDFILLPLMPAFQKMEGDLHDAVRGCIARDADGKRACGPLTMDTGAPGIWVTNSDLGNDPWPAGTSATLTFLSNEHPVVMERFTVGLKDHASRLIFEHKEHEGGAIRTGLSPYFAFDVLYLPDRNMIGLKPRVATANAPLGVVLSSSANP